MHHVFLIPGFFGFTALGDLTYWGHVRRALERHFGEAGTPVTVHEVDTRPTASLDRRTQRLRERVQAAVRPTDHVHLIGHSSGGLDARLLVSPQRTPTAPPPLPGPILARVRSVVTVSSPHRGTPAAEAFGTLAGARLLQLLSLSTVSILRRGSLPLRLVLEVGRLLTRLENRLDDAPGIEDELFAGLLDDLDAERRERLTAFFRDVGTDRDLLDQITPTSMRRLNSRTPDAPGVRYGCVVTRARRPGLRGLLEAGASPFAQGSHAVYVACHRLAQSDDAGLAGPLTDLTARWPDLALDDNDGMVPTASQPWGRVLDGVTADHLDVLGHFAEPTLDPPHYDWLRSGSGYRRARFAETWERVATFLLDDALPA